MNLDKIREMSDADLQRYLRSLSDRQNNECVKCGKKDSNYTVNIQNKKKSQQRKLCNLCESCYGDLLDYLATCDVIWE